MPHIDVTGSEYQRLKNAIEQGWFRDVAKEILAERKIAHNLEGRLALISGSGHPVRHEYDNPGENTRPR